MRRIGIDYSMTCPCVCINDDGDYAYHYLIDKKKYIGKFGNGIYGWSQKLFTSQEQRFDQIAEWAYDLLDPTDIVTMEDYAMGATGRVFHIAENTGLLKHKMYKAGITFRLTSPRSNKMFATGSGSAKKEQMYAAFVAETGLDLLTIFNTKSVANPVSDIADAYFLCNLV
jgi:Holliday junction resolvasome RuvABC endonuclease subunit